MCTSKCITFLFISFAALLPSNSIEFKSCFSCNCQNKCSGIGRKMIQKSIYLSAVIFVICLDLTEGESSIISTKVPERNKNIRHDATFKNKQFEGIEIWCRNGAIGNFPQ